MKASIFALLISMSTFAADTYVDDSKFVYWNDSANYGKTSDSYRYLVHEESQKILSEKGYNSKPSPEGISIMIHTKAQCLHDTAEGKNSFEQCTYQLVLEKAGEYVYTSRSAYFQNLKNLKEIKEQILSIFEELPHSSRF
tara:strand:- start:421 stop:840 length:420 start_codon:yes stop_codon:yes gene_type:complete